MGGMGGMGGMPSGMGGIGGFNNKRRQTQRDVTPFDVLPEGTEVAIKGLTKAPQHNGRHGKVGLYYSRNDRYAIQLASGEAFKLRRKNIQPIAYGTINGLTKLSQANGRRVKILGYDTSKGRYKIALGGKHLHVRPANMILPPGARCIITNLEKAPKWNGKFCAIKRYDPKSQRYAVQVSNSKTVALKPDKVILG